MARLTRSLVSVALSMLGACSSVSEPAVDPEPRPVPASMVIDTRTVIFSDTVAMRDGQRWHLELTARSAELQLSPDGSYAQAVTYFARFHGTLGFGGTWTFEVTPTDSGSELVLTEHGDVSNPMFRVMSRLFFSPTSMIEIYLADLKKRLGE